MSSPIIPRVNTRAATRFRINRFSTKISFPIRAKINCSQQNATKSRTNSDTKKERTVAKFEATVLFCRKTYWLSRGFDDDLSRCNNSETHVQQRWESFACELMVAGLFMTVFFYLISPWKVSRGMRCRSKRNIISTTVSRERPGVARYDSRHKLEII